MSHKCNFHKREWDKILQMEDIGWNSVHVQSYFLRVLHNVADL
ncbi:hypothetical protein ISN45_At03g003060 [Arabidopsis thaliana x Arabidopsis arenosa]|uniref:Uncharacterized protein n=2 Tax=Arabidopsis TaxID=3701 RepID=A0A8T2FEG3_ARASU|nr:hypothetical protein ISN45_At03g003060 [Arabidopsis thaliana x Arabidopsis arenosa]KAG7629901.1 hypothetical protein ISN44_As03g002980 [Arabidopsis suecica]